MGQMNSAKSTPQNELLVSLPPYQLMFDSFDLGTQDTNIWNVANGGGGVAPAFSIGSAALSGGTTANGYSRLSTVVPFRPTQPGFLYTLETINLEFPVATGSHRFWGLATFPAVPTFANPLTEACGWEVDTAGRLYAIVYQTGTRVVIQNLAPTNDILGNVGNGKQPMDSSVHKYFMYFRGEFCYWAIDQFDNVVATFSTGQFGPNANTLFWVNQVVSNGGTTAATIGNNATTIGDTAHSTVAIGDGTYGFRKVMVGANGGLGNSPLDGYKATYSASVTGLVGVAGDVFIINGSATKTIRVTRMCFSGTATAAADMDITLVKRSTADTAGTGVAATPHDSLSAAATAVVQSYTAAPTPGAAVGTPIRSVKAFISTATSAPIIQAWDFGNGPKQCPVLRGVAQGLALNVSATQVGALYDIDIEWTEE